MIQLLSQLVEHLRLGRRTVLGIPFVWLSIFFAVPFLILLRLSVTDMGDQLNPFASLLSYTEAEGWKRTGHYAVEVFASGDAIEGSTAFAEKRKPQWKGK